MGQAEARPVRGKNALAAEETGEERPKRGRRYQRDAVAKTMDMLGDQWNTPTLVAAYVEGLESPASEAPKIHVAYVSALQAAADAARRLRRD